MVNFFLRVYDFLSNRQWLLRTIVFAIIAGSIVSALRINYEEDISAFLPVTDETKEYTEVYSEMGGQNRIAVIFSGEQQNAVAAMDAFGEYIEKVDTANMVKDLTVTVDEEQMMSLMEYLWQIYPLLMTDNDYLRMDSLLEKKDYISAQMQENKKMLTLPLGSVLAMSLPYDPLHISTEIIQKIKKNGLNGNYQIIEGHIFSKDQQKGIVLLTSQYGISESKMNKELVDMLDVVSLSVKEKFKGVEISSIGAPVIAVGNATQIKNDSFWAVSLSIILIFLILYYSFRRWGDILWIGASITFGWLLAIGSFALFNDSMSIIVLGIGSVIIGIAVNYPLHYLDHLKHEPCSRSALKEMAPPLLIGNITTVSAFLCLVFMDAKAMRDLGLFGSLMLVGTILFVLFFLPCFTKRTCSNRNVHTLLPNASFPLPTVLRRYLLPIVVILTVFFGYYSFDTKFDSNIQHINYITKEQKRELKFLASSLESNDTTVSVFAVSKGSTMDKALECNEELLAEIENTPHIRGVAGIGNFVLSEKLRREREKKWVDYWGKHKDVIATLVRESSSLGFSLSALSPFMEMCDGHLPDEIDNDAFINLIGNNYIQKEADGNIRIVNVLAVDKEMFNEVKQILRSRTKDMDVLVFDNVDVSSNLVSLLSDSFNYLGFMCGFVVFIFLWLSFGRLELCLISFLPLAVSWIWILGFMTLTDIQFNIVNIILATFIFGQGDDYSIFITEGLTYEYTYGRKRLRTYKDSVALSAILMFVGIGSLISAKHPALFCLAEVAIIGMITVVVMTFYLPPKVFGWITTRKGAIREVPLTIERILYSLWSLSFFLFFSLLFFGPYAIFHIVFLSHSKKCRIFFHRVLQEASRFVIYRVPGVKYEYINNVGETLDKPAVIICNHQSHLDVMCLLMMSPKIVILTNDWVWNNPFYGAIIRAAEFYPISDGIDKNTERLKDLVARGYSVVVFPEGTRESGRDIMRFHQGAFTLAKVLQLDILPVMIHGLVDVLPKRDFMLRRGKVTLEVHQRMSAEEIQNSDPLDLTKTWHKWYIRQYEAMSRRIEDVDYWLPYVRYNYMYKSYGVESHCKKALNELVNKKSCLDRYFRPDGSIVIENSGYGEIAILLALANPQNEVYAYAPDADSYAISMNINIRPKNVHFFYKNIEP